jgi:hypothetical protein
MQWEDCRRRTCTSACATQRNHVGQRPSLLSSRCSRRRRIKGKENSLAQATKAGFLRQLPRHIRITHTRKQYDRWQWLFLLFFIFLFN